MISFFLTGSVDFTYNKNVWLPLVSTDVNIVIMRAARCHEEGLVLGEKNMVKTYVLIACIWFSLMELHRVYNTVGTQMLQWYCVSG